MITPRNILLFAILLINSCLGKYSEDLLNCFDYKKDYWIVGFAFHTTAVQFKDECLRDCLRAMINSNVSSNMCLSAMHVPEDDRCVLSDVDDHTNPDLFVHNDAASTFTVHYFRNKCGSPPDEIAAGGRLWARLEGYKGSQGVVEVAQKKGKNPQIMVVMTGLSPGKDYDIFYAPGLESSVCRRMASVHNADLGQKLITVDSDSTGMGIQPWTEIDWHILDDDVPNKILVVAESKSGIVVDCGKLTVKGNMSDWEAALNTVPSASNLSLVYALSVLFALFFAF